MRLSAGKASGKPSLIEVKTVTVDLISPNKQNMPYTVLLLEQVRETAATHKLLVKDYEPFEIPEQVYADFKENVANK